MFNSFAQAFAVELIGALTGAPVSKRDEGVDPGFAAARREVAKAIRQPFVSLGEPGYRRADGIHQLELGGTDDDAPPQSALEAVRRRRARRGD